MTTSANASLLNNFEIAATSLIAFLLGFISYGLSIFFYVYAQRELGAAKTSVYYAIAPFAAVGISFVVFREVPTYLLLHCLL